MVLAKDTRGNTAIERSNAFRLDNTPPVINIVGDNPINALQGMVYTDPGTTVTEEHSGVNGSVVLTGTLNVNQRGTYNVYYDVSDNAGNEATRVTRTVNVIEAVFTYDYTGSVVPVSLPAGKYKLEVWGAQGGTYNASNNQGGYGGYSVGVYETASATTLYIAVGGQAQTFNGGGTGGGYVTHVGGGATHIATRTGELSTLSSYLSSILIVAGGGGGCGKYVNGGYGVWTGRAGDGGGIQGNLPTNQQYCPYYCSSGGSRGTQSAGGAGGGGSYGTGGAGTFGRGGAAAIYGGWYDTGGGGGGYYGGGGAGGGSAGGGGSGYIGGVVSNATYGITRTMYCYSCTTSTVDGTRTSSTTNVSATATANYAKSGNGYAKITYLGP